MDNTCQRPESFSSSDLSITRLDVESMGSSNTRPEIPQISVPQPGSNVLPELDLFDGSDAAGDSLKICLNKELSNPKPFAALTTVSLANCDPKFKILIDDLTNTCGTVTEDQKAQSAKALIEFAKKEGNEQYQDLLMPHMNHLFELAYPFPKMTK